MTIIGIWVGNLIVVGTLAAQIALARIVGFEGSVVAPAGCACVALYSLAKRNVADRVAKDALRMSMVANTLVAGATALMALGVIS